MTQARIARTHAASSASERGTVDIHSSNMSYDHACGGVSRWLRFVGGSGSLAFPDRGSSEWIRCLRRWAGKACSSKAINRFVGLVEIKSETSVERSRKGRNSPSWSGRKFAAVSEVEGE